MKILASAIAAAGALLVLAPAHGAKAASLPKPCAVRSQAIAAVGPCFGSVGMTLGVTVYRPHAVGLTALLFEPPSISGAPQPVVTPLLGKGRVLSAAVPSDLCQAGNNTRWQIWLVGPYGKRLGRIGDFTIVGCP